MDQEGRRILFKNLERDLNGFVSDSTVQAVENEDPSGLEARPKVGYRSHRWGDDIHGQADNPPHRPGIVTYVLRRGLDEISADEFQFWQMPEWAIRIEYFDGA